MDGINETIVWGKLNPLLAWKTFCGLESEGNLSLKDCQQCKLTLENTRLNLLEGVGDVEDCDIDWIEDKMSLVEAVIIGLENNVEILHQNLDYDQEKLLADACSRCTMKSSLCQFHLCQECCLKSDCQLHQQVLDPNYWKDHLSDDEVGTNNKTDSSEKPKLSHLDISEKDQLEAFFKKKNKKKKKKNQKESWADSLFGTELSCSDCGNTDLFSQGQFENYCYVCKHNVKA